MVRFGLPSFHQATAAVICAVGLLAPSARAADYPCNDPKVLNRLKENLFCGLQCVPGMTNEEVAKKSEADLSGHIQGLLSAGHSGQESADVITRYIASVFARGIIDGLTGVIGITTQVRNYDPVNHQYECEADIQFDSAKLASFEKFFKLKLLLAPRSGSVGSIEAQRAIAASRTDPQPLENYLSNEVDALMASGFQNAMSKVRFTARGEAPGELVLTVDSDFTNDRMLHRSPGP